MWQVEFTQTSPKNQRVQYETRVRSGDSAAERRDRVKVSGKVVHTGWASDHQGFALYEQYAQEGYTERKTS
jgi:hypothetical protein